LDQVLQFRVFDGDGNTVADTDENGLTDQARPIADLRNRLQSLWPPHALTTTEKDWVITAVKSIVGRTAVVPLPPPPETKLDVVQRIWQQTLPHRELVISGGKVDTRVKGDPTRIYNAAEMSDGERVIFYLIGQCLAVRPNSVIVIDEPELHLHKSIQAKLFDEIESYRNDCMFVYLTHDLDFASSRVNAKKIWLKSYDGTTWDWDVVPESDAIPEGVLLSILGSRKPIIFIEGDRSSWDYFLFTHLYPGYTVAPAGNGDLVLHATRSFARMTHLHTLACYGIIDRDYRSDERIEYLKTLNVHALEISEIENLLLAEEVLRAIAVHLRRASDADSLIEKFKSIVLTDMESEKERLVSSLAASEIETMFKNFNNKALGEQGLIDSLNDTVISINVQQVYASAETKVTTVLANRDYRGAIKLYNNKGLLAKAAQMFGMKNNLFQSFIRDLIIDPEVTDAVAAMKSYIPRLP
jgi:hypothetical protein